ncbi:hypothetical protein D9M70_591810 [compost metagenome]
MQHHVGGTITEVMPLPHHIAQVIVQVFAGGKWQQAQFQAQLFRQRFGDVDIDANTLVGKWRELVVHSHFQAARLLHFLPVGTRRRGCAQRQTSERDHRARAAELK